MGTPLPAEPWDLPAEDDVAEPLLHLLIRILLLECTRRWFATHGRRALVGSDQFVYWVPRNPHRVVAPDLYVVLGEGPDRSVRVLKTWEDGVPELAVEVVSDDIEKDYVLGPARYAELGVRELVVFDPLAGGREGRLWLQLYRRDAEGRLARVDLPHEDRGEHGDAVFPTYEEAERAQKEVERAQKEVERAQKEAEQAANRVLRAQIERLQQELARKNSSEE